MKTVAIIVPALNKETCLLYAPHFSVLRTK